MFAIVLQDLTDLADRSVDAVIGVEERALPPHALDDLLPRHQLPAMLHEEQEDVHGDALQPERLAGAPEQVRCRIEFEAVAKPNSCHGLHGIAAPSSFHQAKPLRPLTQLANPAWTSRR
jgi:hypothetical protein